jgi:hypothetical protein
MLYYHINGGNDVGKKGSLALRCVVSGVLPAGRSWAGFGDQVDIAVLWLQNITGCLPPIALSCDHQFPQSSC